MDWNISWIFIGGIAYLFAIINLIRSLIGKNKGWQILMFCSLSCAVLTVLEEYQMIGRWLKWGETNAIMDVVPSVSETLAIAVYVGLFINLIALIINLKRAKK